MVLTNLECWAYSFNSAATAPNGVSPQLESVSSANTAVGHSFDPFNSRNSSSQQMILNGATVPGSVNAAGPYESPTVSHIASNGYYGFSYVNAAHELNNNNNRNYANGAVFTSGSDVAVAAGNALGAGVGAVAGAVLRCKKRCFARDLKQDLLFRQNNGLDYSAVFDDEDDLEANRRPKRSRFDDDFAAQYCNDFFSLPSNQIGPTSAANYYMDMEDTAINPAVLQLQQTTVVKIVNAF